MTPRYLAVVGLGSNMAGSAGCVEGQLVRACEQMEAEGTGRIVQRSRMFATPPWGGVEQEDFRNAVIAVETALDPLAFLHACQSIEQAAERVRELRWGPRTLDVDVLAMYRLSESSDATSDPIPVISDGQWGDELIIPHPYAHQRAFVLVPWMDLDCASDARFPLHGQSVSYWLDTVREADPKEVEDVTAVEALALGWGTRS
ncbi:2-amino-4-hydroxy-6-hydroxymethyldihydropteridine diphosphokinase [Corynebacterium anserum]|uniref:2-amino-4-hydroxy-6-hydroxymethyldihydropteridine diphosphokinase n=1 Tax=Corynebacterium anserum TaxID=2684406 RepID=A0A7G7YM08_9CORY|nr:2-amino-4-hydroxy-6-hydroxymethyldihydropteridine diphosphokinase [Corynebacterium anserum]MBC2681296.1 2-amino-4-hydroxy-6-hydroxymethyldihydropteridine diphosphokinase [Corynebacterium anserum]QNH95528.1 2-amino-4-hydroxy-6-hydroxymethyldihydropteridine diphosphokinase [Corynebacterium anserum]